MKKGLYDEVISDELNLRLSDVSKEAIISEGVTEYDIDQKILELTSKKLNKLDFDTKIAMLKEFEGYNVTNLQKLNGIKSENYDITYPRSKFDRNFLFTGSLEDPTLIEEFRKELKSCDKFLMLVSFIKKSGLSPLIDELEKFTNRGGVLKIITTTYMQASDFEAIVQLGNLRNTFIKINYDNSRTRLHAKSYLFLRNTDLNSAYIGSSNFSHPAMNKGLEWNVKITSKTSNDILVKFKNTFLKYWDDETFKIFDATNEVHLNLLKMDLDKSKKKFSKYNLDYLNIQPYDYQKNILLQLDAERERGNYRNLVVAATGTGKTVIAAFDFKYYLDKNPNANLLFVVHREEILKKSLETFRIILNDNNFGSLYTSSKNTNNMNNLFISNFGIKKLSSKQLDKYDFIIIDEAHHIAATSYKKLILLNPNILLGLTATPFRGDGKDILEYFNNKPSAELDLIDSMNNKLISPFNYYGVSDNIDYRDINMNGTLYVIDELDQKLMNVNRTRTIINAVKKYTIVSEVIGLGFCSSIKHAEFMTKQFNELGINSFCLTGQTDKNLRNKIQSELLKGVYQFIFTVDLYNEGVDIAEVNTVLFLRPTESPVIFAQQLGRGLRLHEKKEVLTVIDFIGNANKKYNYLTKFKVLLPNGSIKEQIKKDSFTKPLGCEIILEEKAREYILENLSQSSPNKKYFSELYYEGVTLSEYFTENDIDVRLFYKKTTFTEIVFNIDSKQFANSFKQLIKTTDLELLEFIYKLINKKEEYNRLDVYMDRLYKMAFYTLLTDKTPFDDSTLSEYIDSNPKIVKEISELIEFQINSLNLVRNKLVYDDVPLKVGDKYTIYQIKAAFDRISNSVEKTTSGVETIAEYKTYLLYVTLNKRNNHIENKFDYEDKVISSHKMNWITEKSKNGMRVTNITTKQFNNFMFLRDDKFDLYGNSDSYYFVGEANFSDITYREEKEHIVHFEFAQSLPIHFTSTL